VAEAWRDS